MSPKEATFLGSSSASLPLRPCGQAPPSFGRLHRGRGADPALTATPNVIRDSSGEVVDAVSEFGLAGDMPALTCTMSVCAGATARAHRPALRQDFEAVLVTSAWESDIPKREVNGLISGFAWRRIRRGLPLAIRKTDDGEWPVGAVWWRVRDLAPEYRGLSHNAGRQSAGRKREVRRKLDDPGIDRSSMGVLLWCPRRVFAIETGQIGGLYLLRHGVAETLIAEGFGNVRGVHSVGSIGDDTL